MKRRKLLFITLTSIFLLLMAWMSGFFDPENLSFTKNTKNIAIFGTLLGLINFLIFGWKELFYSHRLNKITVKAFLKQKDKGVCLTAHIFNYFDTIYQVKQIYLNDNLIVLPPNLIPCILEPYEYDLKSNKVEVFSNCSKIRVINKITISYCEEGKTKIKNKSIYRIH